MLNNDTPWLEANDTLVCFGDSITSEGGYVEMLQQSLKPMNINVINAGRGGDKTPWALTRFQQILDAKPSAISIYLGTNDSAIGRRRWADEPVVPPEAYKCNLIWMAYLAKLAGITKISITPPAYRFEGESYAEFGDIMAPYRIAARDAADAAQCRFVPLDIVFAEEWARHPGHTGLLLTRDGVHMTDTGNSLIAGAMLKAWRMQVSVNSR